MSATMTPGQRQNAEYLRSPRWRIIRAVRRTMDGHHCRVCFSRDHLQVHHATYAHRGRGGLPGMVREARDVITLCAHCHAQLHR